MRSIAEVFEYVEKLLARLPESDSDKAAKVLEDILDPAKCWEKFLKPDDKSSLPDCFQEEDLDDDEDVVVVPAGPMASVKEGFNKATGMLFDLLLEVISGKHFADCQELAKEPLIVAKLLSEMEGGKAEDAVELLKQLHLITTMFDGAATKSVSGNTAVPAPSLLTQLSAEGEIDGERERAWKAVQAERRKLVSFSVPKTWTKDALLASFRGCGKVFQHNGILNTSHRLFIASADLITEQGEEPWINPTPPPNQLWQEIVGGFLSPAATGSADFLIAFDGRMREIRRLNDTRCFYSGCLFSFVSQNVICTNASYGP